jgi:hypothetical protein
MSGLALGHIASRIIKSRAPGVMGADCFILVFGNGRPVVDEDFGQTAFATERYSCPLRISGWNTINDGLPFGNLTVPYWVGEKEAERAMTILVTDYKKAGLGTPDVLPYQIEYKP